MTLIVKASTEEIVATLVSIWLSQPSPAKLEVLESICLLAMIEPRMVRKPPPFSLFSNLDGGATTWSSGAAGGGAGVGTDLVVRGVNRPYKPWKQNQSMHTQNSHKTHSSYHPRILRLLLILPNFGNLTTITLKNVVTHFFIEQFSSFSTNVGYLGVTQPL
ncbi:hypothetical protein H5410_061929 [Solanum commersonii]|uniref:Uncharacterized protein n=1 Tax=Solanum commersonii TaxID=4109 RepID=A0A9J5W919_SOLCO|nr:hypothetical protein H5410_061929 [Solanum commersonii]